MAGGVSYLPLDVHLDDKFELIEAEFGLTGFAVVVKLLQKIYGEQGYYCEWTDEVALLFARRCGVGAGVVSEIVAASIRRGIFDGTVFERYGVLTSRGIQKRYFKMTKRRTEVEVKKEYLLVPYAQKKEDVCGAEENGYKTGEIVCSGGQGKVRESKVSEGKGRDTRAELERRYGRATVERYLRKAERYRCTGERAVERIALWLSEDEAAGKVKSRRGDSFDMDRWAEASMRKLMEEEG